MTSKDAWLWSCLYSVLLLCGLGAKHVTPNFEVEAPTAAIAEKVALTAERAREELAVEWLGTKLPNWSRPCQIHVKVGQVGAGGATTFSFGGGHVFGWDMTVQGPLDRILDSVIPHEVSHTIFACYFRRPLPRWADEGAATLAEETSERRRQQKMAEEVIPSKRRIPLRELLQITEYPKNMQHVLTLYAEGFSLADYLVQKRGKGRFLAFVQDAHESGWRRPRQRRLAMPRRLTTRQRLCGRKLRTRSPLHHARSWPRKSEHWRPSVSVDIRWPRTAKRFSRPNRAACDVWPRSPPRPRSRLRKRIHARH